MCCALAALVLLAGGAVRWALSPNPPKESGEAGLAIVEISNHDPPDPFARFIGWLRRQMPD
jgi:hypothetical protein